MSTGPHNNEELEEIGTYFPAAFLILVVTVVADGVVVLEQGSPRW